MSDNPTPSVTEEMLEAATHVAAWSGDWIHSDSLSAIYLAMRAADQPPSDDEYKLPCDVRLPPATVIKAGCSLTTLKLAMELEGRPKEFRTNQPPPNTGLTDVERVARAIAKDAGEHWFACDRYSKENERWLKAARAAIAAMQQPVPII